MHNPDEAVSWYHEEQDLVEHEHEDLEGLKKETPVVRLQQRPGLQGFVYEQAFHPAVRGIMALAINTEFSDQKSDPNFWFLVHQAMVDRNGAYYSEAYVRNYREQFNQNPS